MLTVGKKKIVTKIMQNFCNNFKPLKLYLENKYFQKTK